MKVYFILIICCFITSNVETQSVVQGSVKDETGMALDFASVALLNGSDSTLYLGCLTDIKGGFTIENVTPGIYLIFVSYLGYNDSYSDIFELKTENKSASFDIKLMQQGIVLEETVIKAKRPFLEQKADRLVVNVANSSIAAGGTAMEILQKVPGVVIIQDKVTIGGSQNLQIWIDGKPSPYVDMNTALRDMPGDQIEKIELITQPGAQYDAAGGPILNIVLKRNADLGFKGTLALTLGGYRFNQADVDAGKENYYRVNPSLNLTYRSGKINLFSNASYNKGDYFTIIKVDRYINTDIYKSKSIDRVDYIFSNIRVGGDYYLSNKTTIGTVFRTWQRTGNGKSFNKTNVFDQNETILYSTFNTENASDSERSGSYGNVNLKHDINIKTGHSLNLDIDYNRFNTRNINNLQIYANEKPASKSLSKQDVDQPVNIWVGKFDYKYPVDSTFKVETGLKTSFATVDSRLNFFRNNFLSLQESNTFLYKENINAAYINLQKTFTNFELNAGIRTEQTIISGISKDVIVLNRNYTQLFPSASLIYRLNKNLAIQSSYSKRVNRPGFQQQNPFSYFIDSLTYTRGNPNLKPENLQTAQLNFTFDNQPFIGIAYYKTNDVIIENAPKLEGTRTFATAENLANQTRMEIQLNFPIKIGKIIDGFGGNQAIYNSYNASYQGLKYEAKRWHWLAYWQINAALPKDIKLEFGGFYMTKFLEEFLTINNIAGVNLGISKSFADKRGRVALSFNDILYSQNTNAIINFSNVNVHYFQREYTRQLRLTYSYQFGNSKVKNQSTRSNASEIESSRVKID